MEAKSGPATEAAAAVVFSHVSLAFDDHVVLRDLSFSVPKGGMRFLLGAGGSGKSVVLKLVLGLVDRLPSQLSGGQRRRVAQIGFMILHEGRLHFQGPATELLGSNDPYLKRFMLNTLPPW